MDWEIIAGVVLAAGALMVGWFVVLRPRKPDTASEVPPPPTEAAEVARTLVDARAAEEHDAVTDALEDTDSDGGGAATNLAELGEARRRRRRRRRRRKPADEDDE